MSQARRAAIRRAARVRAAEGVIARLDAPQSRHADADDKDDLSSLPPGEAAALRRGLANGRRREAKRIERILAAATEPRSFAVAASIAFDTRNTSADAKVLIELFAANVASSRFSSRPTRRSR